MAGEAQQTVVWYDEAVDTAQADALLEELREHIPDYCFAEWSWCREMESL